MDQDKYIEVTIIESTAEIPTSDVYPVRGINAIHKHNSSKAVHSWVQNGTEKNVPISSSLKSTLEHPPLQQRRNSSQKLDQPLDIELLLRYYACNSNMEKSINNVLKNTNEKSFEDVNEGPLVELNAASKICDSLKESSSTSSILTTFRFHDLLTKLRRLISSCNNKKLEQILSNDPSIKMCKHCGVISCSRSLNIPVEPRKSPPNTSYFLNPDVFFENAEYNSEDSKIRNQVKTLNAKKGEKNIPKRRRSIRKKENEVHGNSRKVETMIAERENDNQINNRECVRNEMESQVRKMSPSKEETHEIAVAVKKETPQQTKINSIFENKDTIKNSTSANFINNYSFDKRFSRADCKQKLLDIILSNKQKNLNEESNEKVVKDILYEKPRSQLHVDSLKRVNDNQLTDLQLQSTPFVNITTHLARGRPESLDKRNKGFVSQPDERTCVHSRRSNDQHSFILHGGQTNNPSSNLDSSKIASKYSSNGTKPSKYTPPKNIKEPNSFTDLMEDDSLETCIKLSKTLSSGSDGTVVSSSSAENMIREWVNPSTKNEINKESGILKHSVNDTKLRSLWSNDRSIERQNDLGTYTLKKTWRSVSSRRPENPFGQTMSYTLDSKSPNNDRLINNKIKASSFRKIEGNRGKKFFGPFKRTMKSKENDLNIKSSIFPGNHLLGDYVRNITRRIIYNDSSLRRVIGNCGRYDGAENILLLYRKMLEDTEKMDWQSFKGFVEELHPSQRELWRDICQVIDNEARRLADKGSTEVCIEITSAASGTMENRTCNDEIVFEMDITLEEVERCLGRQLASTEKAQLDILQTANEVIKLRNDDVCDTEVVFNQAEQTVLDAFNFPFTLH